MCATGSATIEAEAYAAAAKENGMTIYRADVQRRSRHGRPRRSAPVYEAYREKAGDLGADPHRPPRLGALKDHSEIEVIAGPDRSAILWIGWPSSIWGFLMRTFAAVVTLLALAAALLFVLGTGVMLTYEVVARYFFTAPTIWAAELSQMCLIWGSLIAMPWCAGSERRHIQITAVTALLSPGGRRLVSAAAMITVAVFSVIVLGKGFEIFWDSFERGRTTGSLLNLPVWIAELSIPVGFFLLLAQSLIETGRAFRGDLAEEGRPLE